MKERGQEGRERGRRGQGFRRVSIVFHKVGEGGEGVKGVHREQGGGGRGEGGGGERREAKDLERL